MFSVRERHVTYQLRRVGGGVLLVHRRERNGLHQELVPEHGLCNEGEVERLALRPAPRITAAFGRI